MAQKSILIILTFVFLLFTEVIAQNNDCDKMLVLKDTIYKSGAIAGYGARKDFSGNALGDAKTFENEVNSIWYFIKVQEDGVLTFDIVTANKIDDWDFILYPYSSGFCEKVANKELVALRSNLSRSAITGLSQKGKESFVAAGVNANYSRPIRVKKGNRYVLVVNNPKRAGGKHTLLLHYDQKIGTKKKPFKTVVAETNVENEPQKVMPTTTLFQLEVKDAATKKPLLAYGSLTGLKNGTIELKDQSSFKEEVIKKNRNLIVDVSAKGYMLVSKTFKVGKNKINFLAEVLLEKIEAGKKVNLKNIQFYGNKADFLPKATSSLKALLSFMNQNPNVMIEVEGHVNGPGQKNSKDYQELSYARAYAVKEYLIKAGIDKERIDFKGYGNSQMLYPKPKSPFQESANRRVEIKIVSNAYNSRN